MARLFFLLLFLLSAASSAFAQQHATNIPPLAPPNITSETPDWARQMYAEAPNVHEVDRLFNLWFRSHALEKTVDTRNYKHWRRHLARYDMVQPDGRIQVPTDEEQEAATQQWLARKAQFDQQVADRGGSPTSNWEQIGPYENTGVGTTYTSVQSCQVAFSQCLGDLNVLYSVSQNGKVFKTTNHGASWSAVGENIFFSGDTWTEQCISVHPTDPDIVYYGTGTKIWKTTDGGGTWSTLFTLSGLEPNCIVINPSNPDLVFVSSDKGIYRSTNAGAGFTQVRAGNAWDLRFKTDQPNTLFAICRNGTRSDFYKSTDSGTTWLASTTGWFSDAQDSDGGGRMTVSTSNPNLIYCFILGKVTGDAAAKPIVGVAKSTNAGATWTTPITWNATQGIHGGQGYYDLDIEVSDTDDNLVMLGTQGSWKTTNGFITVTGGVSGQHADPQEYHFNGPNDMWVASDGGMDLYNATLTSRQSQSKGITGTEFWGFDQGWNEDTRVGSYYHNGTSGHRQNYPNDQFRATGGAEPATGYISVGNPGKVWFSEVGGKYLPTTLTGTVTNFTYGRFPNESYWGQDVRSEIVPHPLYYNTHFLGKDNVLWKTTDGGTAFTSLYTFGSNPLSLVTSIEISRSNPDILLVYQLIESNGSYTSGKLWKTTDGGATFTEITQPANASYLDGCFIALSPSNPDHFWIAYNKTNTAYKVFKTTNGGATWTNITGTALNGLIPRALLHIGGTDGGVYLMTPHLVFYRNNTHSDWQAFGNGLPAKLENNYLRPFYKEGKIRMATVARGLWSVDFYENPTAVFAQPTVDKITSDCHRDTFYFEDYSMLQHTGASWAWSFSPAPQFVSSTSVRNPKVVFGAAGAYTVALTITDGNGHTDTKTVTSMVTLGPVNGCDLTAGPEKSMQANGGSNYATTRTALPIGTTNTLTICGWIKPSGTQSGNAGIAMTNAGNGGTGLNFRSNNQLGYHWNEEVGSYSWANGPTVQADVWSHVALVVEPTKATIYLNGVPFTRTATHVAIAFASAFNLGNDRGTTARTMNGELDEFRFYNRALTQNEIREIRHLTYPGGDPNLVAYYKFNEASGVAYDRIGLAHANLGAGVNRLDETGPFDAGVSKRSTVTASGPADFAPTDLLITFAAGTTPNGELCTSRLDGPPHALLTDYEAVGNRYWVVNNYGSNATFTALSNMVFSGLPLTEPNPAAYQLYKRSSNGHLVSDWVFVDVADVVTTGANGAITFNTGLTVTAFSQFVILVETQPLPIVLKDFFAKARTKTIDLYWQTETETAFQGFDIERARGNTGIFQKIGYQQGKQGAVRADYTLSDADVIAGQDYFYRLKMLDLDGGFAYSPLATARIQGGLQAQAFPNPTNALCILRLETTFEDRITIRILDASGKWIQSLEAALKKGVNDFDLDLSHWPAGLYQVHVLRDQAMEWDGQVIKN